MDRDILTLSVGAIYASVCNLTQLYNGVVIYPARNFNPAANNVWPIPPDEMPKQRYTYKTRLVNNIHSSFYIPFTDRFLAIHKMYENNIIYRT
jgi:hypothetical protein